jgi:malonyl-CoA O-methyltransferase
LLGKERLQQLKAAYEMHRRDERLPLSYEVIYGHAWGAVQQRQEGAVMVSPESLRMS